METTCTQNKYAHGDAYADCGLREHGFPAKSIEAVKVPLEVLMVFKFAYTLVAIGEFPK